MNTQKKQFTQKSSISFKTFMVLAVGFVGSLFGAYFLPWRFWALVIFGFVYALSMVLLHNAMTIAYNDLISEYGKREKIIKSLNAKNEQLKKDTAELGELRNRTNSLTSAIFQIKQDKKELSEYQEAYRTMYIDIKAQDTRLYAMACFKNSITLKYFDPVRYRLNEKYAKIIDIHAEELLTLVNAVDPNDMFMRAEQKLKTRLEQLLKNGGGPDSSGAFLELERKTLKKIDVKNHEL